MRSRAQGRERKRDLNAREKERKRRYDDGDNDDDKTDDNAGEHAAAGDTARIGRNPGRLPPSPPQESIRSF